MTSAQQLILPAKILAATRTTVMRLELQEPTSTSYSTWTVMKIFVFACFCRQSDDCCRCRDTRMSTIYLLMFCGKCLNQCPACPWCSVRKRNVVRIHCVLVSIMGCLYRDSCWLWTPAVSRLIRPSKLRVVCSCVFVLRELYGWSMFYQLPVTLSHLFTLKITDAFLSKISEYANYFGWFMF